MEERPLTPKQAKFIDEYLIDLNATAAAKRAGYSEGTAEIIGFENLRKPKIAEKIQARRDELKESAEIDQEWVLKRYKRLAEVDPADFLKEDGTLKPISEIPKDVRYAIQGLDILEMTSVKGAEIHTKKVKLSDKRATLDSIAKLLGLVVDRVKVDINNYDDMSDEELEQELKTLRKRNEP